MLPYAQIKERARRLVHQAFAVPATYTAPGGTVAVPLTVRMHGKIIMGGDIEGEGYATIVENVNKLVFSRDELTAANLTLQANGLVILIPYSYSFRLDIKDPDDGPVTERWHVAQQGRV